MVGVAEGLEGFVGILEVELVAIVVCSPQLSGLGLLVVCLGFLFFLCSVVSLLQTKETGNKRGEPGRMGEQELRMSSVQARTKQS